MQAARGPGLFSRVAKFYGERVISEPLCRTFLVSLGFVFLISFILRPVNKALKQLRIDLGEESFGI